MSSEEILRVLYEAIRDGYFDDIEGQRYTGVERLAIVTDSFITDGTLSEAHQQDLFQELKKRQSHPAPVRGK